jgi:hypothetical protein
VIYPGTWQEMIADIEEKDDAKGEVTYYKMIFSDPPFQGKQKPNDAQWTAYLNAMAKHTEHGAIHLIYVSVQQLAVLIGKIDKHRDWWLPPWFYTLIRNPAGKYVLGHSQNTMHMLVCVRHVTGPPQDCAKFLAISDDHMPPGYEDNQTQFHASAREYTPLSSLERVMYIKNGKRVPLRPMAQKTMETDRQYCYMFSTAGDLACVPYGGTGTEALALMSRGCTFHIAEPHDVCYEYMKSRLRRGHQYYVLPLDHGQTIAATEYKPELVNLVRQWWLTIPGELPNPNYPSNFAPNLEDNCAALSLEYVAESAYTLTADHGGLKAGHHPGRSVRTILPVEEGETVGTLYGFIVTDLEGLIVAEEFKNHDSLVQLRNPMFEDMKIAVSQFCPMKLVNDFRFLVRMYTSRTLGIVVVGVIV